MKILDYIYPPRCPFCGGLSARGALCGDCMAELAEVAKSCPLCGLSRSKCRCRKIEGAGGLTAPFLYRGIVRTAVLELKSSGDTRQAQALAGYMSAALRGSSGAEVITAVPSTPRSFKRRGFNSAELLARELAKWLELPYETLLISKDGPSQKDAGRGEARILNVIERFSAAPGANIEGRRIMVVDDVHTTGATLKACREALLMAGAAYVESEALAID